jgi:hypothetical protein
MYCAEKGYKDCVAALLRVECGVNEQVRSTGSTALMLAAKVHILFNF